MKGTSINGHATAKMQKKKKKELQLVLGIISYLSKFSPMAAEVCQPLQKLTFVKIEWSWNGMYHDLYDKTKNIIR